ncbi:hypothetical protein [Brevundimonas sp.]|uniref:hypothetical protein n=1 Tax=Brevundimonas sp. TaxID=1871086 RepID=UPI0025BF8934|nr:hypothetical protein [Brevundimonas sp.]MCG2664083.1 hypothetical protein [Brevundimonas sp.]
MAKYEVALVRFDGRGQVYPVNGAARFQPSQKVVVEMGGLPRTLKVAEVVGRSVSYKPCKHSIVGRADSEFSYLPGPESVHTLQDLAKFLSDRNFGHAPVKLRDEREPNDLLKQWHTAYMCGHGPKDFLGVGRLHSDYPVIVVGDTHLGLIQINFQGYVSLEHRDGFLILGAYDRVVSQDVGMDCEPFDPKILRNIAETIRGPLASEIREQSPFADNRF